MSRNNTPLDLATVRARLSEKRGKQYWRSLEELAETKEFQAFLHSEFPEPATDLTTGVNRRSFLKLMGASMALAGLTSCTASGNGNGGEKIVPYIKAPEEFVPGKALFFATAATLGGFASGVLVESHQGRPTKIEGNPEHPASLGATTAQTQASILTLYDPERSQVVVNVGLISSWQNFRKAVSQELVSQGVIEGKGLRILTGTVTSPTLASQIEALLALYPEAKWYQYEPVNRDNLLEGAMLAFGQPLQTLHRFEKAQIVLSLDANFLLNGPASVRYARDFTSQRRIAGQSEQVMNRLYVVESSPSSTGAVADHRLSLQASQIEGFTRALAQGLGIAGIAGEAGSEEAEHWMSSLVQDLQAHAGKSIVIAGEHQPPAVHALAHAINSALGNVGQTVFYTEPVEAKPVNQLNELRQLATELEAGVVEMLVIMGTNPVYSAPADIDFATLLQNARLRVHHGLYEDETAELCQWHIPATHYLESWSDARAYDGTTTIIQPLIEPLYEGKSEHDLLALLLGESASSYDIVRANWQAQAAPEEFESFWRRSLHDGIVAGTAAPEVAVALQLEPAALPSDSPTAEGLEIIFQPDPSVWDGQFANNGWLQELPKPLTKLTWDNTALMSLALAEQLGVTNEDVVELHYQGRAVRAPVWVLMNHPHNSVTVHLGYGREKAGQVGTKAGFNAYKLRSSQTPWFGKGLEIRKTDLRYSLASTQHHHSMEGRHLVRETKLVDFIQNPNLFEDLNKHSEPHISLYPEYEYNGYSWGMAIDLSACIGCNACITACQAENNIPVVGKEEVRRGREMHWLRIDRYYEGSEADTLFQPLLCQHCENAPCEVVCPVTATVHDHEGLNVMVYNRCVGTRYCSDNCPYKVRRFNFFQYADFETESLKGMRNPNVSVRSRGIMEKCTYCIQRISGARIEASKEGRQIADGEIVTACQAACPAQAFVFGDINDPNSRVAQLKASKLNYSLLGELNTRPRTSYLAKVRNPNPALVTESDEHTEGHG
jgi:molybdopterin-containing oxidoreductase family iron-sulfur binding subunit